MGRVVVYRQTFKKSVRQPQNCREWQERTAYVAAQAISSAAPRQTGFLKTRVKGFPQRDGTVRFRADVGDPPYGLFQEVGTGLYGPLQRWITPKRAKALSWVTESGDRVFAKRVRGTPPKRYFRLGLWSMFGRKRVRYYGDSGGRGKAKG